MTTQNTTQQQSNKELFKINTNILIDISKTLKEFITDIKINISNDGLKIQEYDNVNICFLDFNLNKGIFENLINDNINIGLNIEILYKLLKENKKTDVVLKTDHKKLYLSFSNGLNSEMDLIDLNDFQEQNINQIHNLEFNTEIDINSKKFKDIIKHFYSNDKKICLSYDDLNKTELKIYTEKSNITLNTDEIFIKNAGLSSYSKSNYSTEYLFKLSKILFTEKIILKYSSDYPLLMEFKTDLFKIKYILAPRVEN